jgi:hypothetical protein
MAAELLISATLSILRAAEQILPAPELFLGHDLFFLQDKLALNGNTLPRKSSRLAFPWFAKLL